MFGMSPTPRCWCRRRIRSRPCAAESCNRLVGTNAVHPLGLFNGTLSENRPGNGCERKTKTERQPKPRKRNKGWHTLVFDQYLRIVILRCGFARLSSLVFIREIREIRTSKTKPTSRSMELALQTSHSDGTVCWCWLRISRRNQTAKRRRGPPLGGSRRTKSRLLYLIISPYWRP